jgi:hypothetical protein
MNGPWRSITISGKLQGDAVFNPCKEETIKLWHCTIIFHQDTLLQIKDIFDTEVIHDHDNRITRSGSWQEEAGDAIRGRTLDSMDPSASLKLSQVEGTSISVIYSQISTNSPVLGSLKVDDQDPVPLADFCRMESQSSGRRHGTGRPYCKHSVNLTPGLHDIELLLTANRLCPPRSGCLYGFSFDGFEVKPTRSTTVTLPTTDS